MSHDPSGPSGHLPSFAGEANDGSAMTAVDALFDALEKAGIEARFVGGCVRGKVLGRADEKTEIDLAVDKPPETEMRGLDAPDIQGVATGIPDGTGPGTLKGRPLEITSPRRAIG